MPVRLLTATGKWADDMLFATQRCGTEIPQKDVSQMEHFVVEGEPTG